MSDLDRFNIKVIVRVMVGKYIKVSIHVTPISIAFISHRDSFPRNSRPEFLRCLSMLFLNLDALIAGTCGQH